MTFLRNCLCFFIICSLLFVCGCGNIIESSNSLPSDIKNLSWPEAVAEIDSLTENDESVFFISDVGIMKHDKRKDTDTILIEGEDINSFRFSDDSIYYCENENAIYRTDFNGENRVKIIELSQLKDLLIEESLANFEIYKDNIYIKSSGISLIRFSMLTKRAEDFVNDVAEYAFFENSLYFTDHIDKSFSLYRKDLDTLQVELLRGDGISKRNSSQNSDICELYDRVAATDECLFYTTRVPAKLFRLEKQGKDVLIDEFNNREDAKYLTVTVNSNKVYYVLESGEFKDFLFEYNIKTGEKKELLKLQNANYAFGIKVIGGYVFYRSNNNCIHFLCL